MKAGNPLSRFSIIFKTPKLQTFFLYAHNWKRLTSQDSSVSRLHLEYRKAANSEVNAVTDGIGGDMLVRFRLSPDGVPRWVVFNPSII